MLTELDIIITIIPQFLPLHCLVAKNQLNLEVIQMISFIYKNIIKIYKLRLHLHMEFDQISISKLLDTALNQNYKLGFWEKLSLLITSGRDDVVSKVL